MLDIILRYHPIIKSIDALKPKNVLEVGSDDYGVAPFLSKIKITLLDTNFRRKLMKNVTYKKGSVLNLPFKNKAFDTVISVDMLEHLPVELRKKAIIELLRVTEKHLFLAFPADQAAEKRDKKLIKILSAYKERPFAKYINEHIKYGIPNSKKIVEIIKKSGNYKIEVVSNLNVSLEIFLVILSNLDFIPILIVQKILDRYKVDILPFMFRFFMFSFGWLSDILSGGTCYRKLLIISRK